MFRIVILLALSLSASVSVKAALIYDFTTSAYGTTHWSFSTPDFLTVTSTVPAANLIIATSDLGTISSVQLTDPLSGNAEVNTFFEPGHVLNNASWGPLPPFNLVGSYTNPAASAVLTISESAETGIAEPSSFLLTSVLGVAGWQLKRRLRRT
jgi:hypothetical protein